MNEDRETFLFYRLPKRLFTSRHVTAIFAVFINRCLLFGSLWFRTSKNWDVTTGPFACPFACLLTPLTYLLALHCLLCSHTLLHLLLGPIAHLLTPELVGKWLIRCASIRLFWTIVHHFFSCLQESFPSFRRPSGFTYSMVQNRKNTE